MAEMASPPLPPAVRIASAAGFDNLAGSLAAQINACVSRRIIGRRLCTGYGRQVRRSSGLCCGDGSFFHDLPVAGWGYRRLDIADDLEFTGHEAKDVALFGLSRNDL